MSVSLYFNVHNSKIEIEAPNINTYSTSDNDRWSNKYFEITDTLMEFWTKYNRK